LAKSVPRLAKSGSELKDILVSLVKKPNGKDYTGKLYKSVSKTGENSYGAKPDIISEYSIEEAWGRYDLKGESAMYYSETFDGNQAEMSHYGNWADYSTYEFSNVTIQNVLDLTDFEVRKQLSVVLDYLTRTSPEKITTYEFTNVLGTWARNNGYKGLIVPGARGSKDYKNVIIFSQDVINQVFNGQVPAKLK